MRDLDGRFGIFFRGTIARFTDKFNDNKEE